MHQAHADIGAYMKKILLVEDEERIRSALELAFRNEGHEVVSAGCGRTGLELARSAKPDIVLLDVMLPHMDGIEVCRALKSDAEHRAVPIVMLTALGDHENTIRGLSAGANDYVSKPFELGVLVARVNSHLRMKEIYDLVKVEEEEKSELLNVSQILSSTVDPFENLHTIVSRIADAIDVKRCSIVYLDTLNRRAYVMASHDSREVKRLELELEKYPEIQRIMETKKQVVVNDALEDPIFSSQRQVVKNVGIRSIMAFPIIFRDTLIGTLVLRTSQRESFFNNREVRFCEVISHLAAAPLKNAYVFEALHAEKEVEKGKRVAAEDQLQLAAKVFENAIEGVMITDPEGIIQSVNPAFTSITGYSAEEALGKNQRVLQSDRHDPLFFENILKTLQETGRWQGETWSRKKSGEAYPQWTSITANNDYRGKTKHYVSVFHDISEVKQSREQDRYRENHDALTDLPGKTLFKDLLGQSLTRARRNKTKLAVLFLDLDHFKKVNEGLGHFKGDQTLKSVAERLKGVLRKDDTLARWGGDDFTIVLENIKGPEGAVKVARNIQKALSEPFQLDERSIHLTASLGIALYPDNGEDTDTLIKNADHALYLGKEKGRNYYQLFTPSMNTITADHLELEADLRKALEREEIRVYYQPKLDLSTGAIIGMEALARWKHPVKGFISPAVFIPLAEESGLIAPMGAWILREACRHAKAWVDDGYSSLHVGVNISAVQFGRQNLPKKVAAILEETGLDPRHLELEVTESLVMRDVASAIATMREIRRMGVSFSMDDFGTGYSSLSYLKQFPISSLKIDRSFILEIATDPNAAAIAGAIISLAHNLGLKVVAEGAETQEHIRFLRERRCDMVQGFIFSPPIPHEDFTKLLQSGKRLEAAP